MNQIEPTFSPNANQAPPTAPIQEAPPQPTVTAPASGNDNVSEMDRLRAEPKQPDPKQLALALDDNKKNNVDFAKEAEKTAERRNKPATEYKSGNDTAWQVEGAVGGGLMTAGGIVGVATSWTGVGLVVGLALIGVGAGMSGLSAAYGGKGAEAQATMRQGEEGRKEMAAKTDGAGEPRKISILEDSMTKGPQGAAPSPTAQVTMESSATPA